MRVKLELIFVFTYYQLDSDYTTTRIVEINDSICIGHLRAFSLRTILMMNLNTNMNSNFTQIIWSKMFVYIRSGCSQASTHFFVWKDPFCTFYVHFWPCKRLASTHFLWRPSTSVLRLHVHLCIRRVISIVHIIMHDKGK